MPEWLKNYRREHLGGDLLAGVIVAVMLIPQSMAYAMLAGVPPQVGFYASIVPMLLYAVAGTSNFLAVGPVAIISLMVASAAGEVAAPGTVQYQQAAVILAWECGAILGLFGLLRFGALANFLSHSVISGFINASALIIAVSQIPILLGMNMPRVDGFLPVLNGLWQHRGSITPATMIIGVGAVIGLLLLREPLGRLLRRVGLPSRLADIATRTGALVVVVAGALLVWLFDLHQAGVPTVGAIPRGMPIPELPDSSAPWLQLLPGAALIAFVIYLESISVARSLASKRRQRVLPDRELLALGLANVGAAVSSAFPVAGGVSRSGVSYAAGTHTQLSGVVAAAFMLVCILLLAPLFFYIPRAVLAAIVLIAVLSLFDIRPLLRSWRYNRADGAATLVTFVAVLATNVETGVLAGLVFSVALYLWRTLHPHIAVVGRVGNSEHFRNVLRHPVTTLPQVAAVRIDESLYFANAHALEEKLLEISTGQKEVRHIVLICSAVNFIDYSALETLEIMVERLRDAGVTLHLAEVKGPVMDRLQIAGFTARLGAGRIYLSTHEAMVALGQQ